jgi:3-isopropylmalate/(R)-2-methylmalate dehydratase large subunit
MTIIGADSHTCTYGALGAFATGVGSTDLAGFYLTGKAWLRVPPTIKAVFKGTAGGWVTGKDLILTLIGKITVSGATYKAIEFTGPAIDALSVEGRLTMANMAIEAGAKNGIFVADAKVKEYLKGRTSPGSRWPPIPTRATSAWSRSTSTAWGRWWPSRTCPAT